MKKSISLSIIAMTIACSSFLFSCNSSDPVAYNNKIMDAINQSENDMTSMNEAMEKEDFSAAESIRTTWEANVIKGLEEVKKMGDFKGDTTLKNACIKSMETFKNSVSIDYKQLIEMRTALKNGDKVDEQKIDELLEKINKDFEKAANDLNAASEKFGQTFVK